VVEEVEAVLFLLVVGQDVSTRAVAMVATPIGVLIVEDAVDSPPKAESPSLLLAVSTSRCRTDCRLPSAA
jgi:hypothetical protein